MQVKTVSCIVRNHEGLWPDLETYKKYISEYLGYKSMSQLHFGHTSEAAFLPMKNYLFQIFRSDLSDIPIQLGALLGRGARGRIG